MRSVEKTIEEIKMLFASGDLSNSLHFQQLHKDVLRIFRDLNENLKECRKLIDNGSIQEARKLNESFDPSLTQTAESLEYFKDNDFFAICKDYNLETPDFPDPQLLAQLKNPVSSSEKKIHILLQDYRKIARNGSRKQRIELLRKIVTRLPNSASWRNDLLSAERARFTEIEQQIRQCPEEISSLEQLETLYRELLDPEWRAQPKQELLEEVRRKLLPLQKEKISAEAEKRLETLNDLFQERDYEHLLQEFEQWRLFRDNPLYTMTEQQLQTESDIEKFLKDQTAAREKEKICKDLIRKIERKLEDNRPYPEIAGDYNQLQLQETPVPEALLSRLQTLEEEYIHSEHLKYIRRSIGGICIALLSVAAVCFAVKYTQHYIALKHNRTYMLRCIQEKRYTEAIALYEKLQQTALKVACEAQIVSLYNTAKEKNRERNDYIFRTEQELTRLLQHIEVLSGKDVLDNKKAINIALDSAKDLLDSNAVRKEELRSRFTKLKTLIIQRRTDLKQSRERKFSEFTENLIRKIDALTRNMSHTESLESQNANVSMLLDKFNQKAASSVHIPGTLKETRKKELLAARKRYEEAIRKEQVFRLVYMPSDFDTYLSGLKKIQYDHVDIAQEYHYALRSMKLWERIYKNYRETLPTELEHVQSADNYAEGFLRSDLEKILPRKNRSEDFKNFYSQLLDLNQKKVKELILTDAADQQYFFYTTGKIYIERLRRPRRTNISFTLMNKEKGNQIIIRYVPREKTTPFQLESAPRDLGYKLPGAFAQFCGEPKLPAIGNDSFLWPGQELTTRFSALGSDGPGLSGNLQEALRFLIREDDFVKNAYLKERFILEILKELAYCSKLCPELKNALESLQNYYRSRTPDWRTPQARPTYQAEKRELQMRWKNLDPDRIIEGGKLRGDFICAFHARRLVPVGIVREANRAKTKLQIHYFVPVNKVKEALILNKDSFMVLPQEMWKGSLKADARFRHLLFNGQVIWSFGDYQATLDFLKEWKKKASRLNILLDRKPSIFPSGITF